MSKTGIYEWADCGMNWQIGCEHDCLYCYARAGALARRDIRNAAAWRTPEDLALLEGKLPRGRRVMLPTRHDITPNNLPGAVACIAQLLSLANEVLVVSKPHLECIRELCARFQGARLEFRFTIGSLREDVLRFWEPGAPMATERVRCISEARLAGFKVSVSAEPVLDPLHLNELLATCLDAGADHVWIGMLNKAHERLAHILNDPAAAWRFRAIDDLISRQNPEDVALLLSAIPLHLRPRVRLKDSYAALVPQDVFCPERRDP